MAYCHCLILQMVIGSQSYRMRQDGNQLVGVFSKISPCGKYRASGGLVDQSGGRVGMRVPGRFKQHLSKTCLRLKYLLREAARLRDLGEARPNNFEVFTIGGRDAERIGSSQFGVSLSIDRYCARRRSTEERQAHKLRQRLIFILPISVSDCYPTSAGALLSPYLFDRRDQIVSENGRLLKRCEMSSFATYATALGYVSVSKTKPDHQLVQEKCYVFDAIVFVERWLRRNCVIR